MVVKKVDNQDDAEFVYWGYGKLKDELTKAQNNPCVSMRVPTHFNYVEPSTDPLKMLKRLKEDFKPLCSNSSRRRMTMTHENFLSVHRTWIHADLMFHQFEKNMRPLDKKAVETFFVTDQGTYLLLWYGLCLLPLNVSRNTMRFLR